MALRLWQATRKVLDATEGVRAVVSGLLGVLSASIFTAAKAAEHSHNCCLMSRPSRATRPSIKHWASSKI